MEIRKDMKKGTQIFSVQGKSALITGATGYLGSAMAYVLAEAGAHVLVNARSQEKGDELVRKLLDSGYSAEIAIFDVTNQMEIENFFSTRQEDALNILINNAYCGGGGSIELSNAEDYVSSYDIALIAAHNLLKAALPALRKAVNQDGDASVINLTSMYAMVSPDQKIYETNLEINPPFYGAAKAALLQWTRYASCEFGKEGIRVNSLSPGPFPSESTQIKSSVFIEKLAKKVPMGRIGKSEEIKGPILFLASSASSFVNGSNIVVDGGWTAW
jgi:NAD(P)-dependent dehydrogenase (short-subunit alcohol dehydrogenase family)